MKKVLIGILVILAIASLVACGNQKENEIIPNNPSDTNEVIPNEVIDDTETQEETPSLTDEEMYESIINDYKNAIDEFDFEDFDSQERIASEYSLVNMSLITHVARYESEGVKLTYYFYDVDKNGIDELLVGASGSLGAIYSYDLSTNHPTKIFFQDTLERGNLEIFDNGVIISSGAGGAALHYYEFGKVTGDGLSYELLEAIEEEYLAENEPPEYRDNSTGAVLEYKGIDEVMDKYILNAEVINNNNYIEM